MRKFITAAAALVLGALSTQAQAAPAGIATYLGTSESGLVTIVGAPGQGVVLRGEQPSGQYAILFSGHLGLTGVRVVPVMVNGIQGNGQAEFLVTYQTSPGSQTVPVILGPGWEPDDGLWLW
jgi:hypothetical protein